MEIKGAIYIHVFDELIYGLHIHARALQLFYIVPVFGSHRISFLATASNIQYRVSGAHNHWSNNSGKQTKEDRQIDHEKIVEHISARSAIIGKEGLCLLA
jgi:hypothetical protein